MKVSLFDFQEDALDDLRRKLNAARSLASVENPQVISFSAPTGAGKTIVMTALFEDIFFGEPNFQAQDNAVVLWISDIPELNEQTRLKIEGKSDRIRVRQLVTLDASFDQERLEGGHIYFVNTQKLGTEKLLTVRKDTRQHTIWETLTNTAQAMPDRFYVVIDEAHRGMRTGKDAEKAQTIMQRFLLGSDADGLCRMPLVIGVSATPKRFEELLSGTTHTVHKVYVKADEVRASGLIKDRILIHYPDTGGQAEMTLLAEAAHRWQDLEKNWAEYCTSENETPIWPILVIQVEDGKAEQADDGKAKILTKTPLNQALAALESAIGRHLDEKEIAHAFNDNNDLMIEGRRVRHIDASRIEEDPYVRVVLFKMGLSTGWDCPRAEVMMSFRHAQDHTYIAQLLGRMVRTPLARRVEKNAALNDVHLFLPHYDKDAVDAVIQDLRDVEDVPPMQTGTSRELVTLQRRKGTESIFDAMSELVTYRVNAVRKQSAIFRLMGLGRALTQDEIDGAAQNRVKEKLIGRMEKEVEHLRKMPEFETYIKQVTDLQLKTVTVRGTIAAEEPATYTVVAASADIDRHFQQAGRLLSNGLHMEYWKTQSERESDEVKVEVVALAQDQAAMQALDQFADKEFNHLYERHKRDIAQLKEQRRQHYQRLRLATAKPQDIPWTLPDSIDWTRSPKAPIFDKHLYVESDGKFRVELGTWEKEVLEQELKNPKVVGWFRNLDRKPWSLEIPYRDSGVIKPMFPDLVIVRKDSKGFVFDILEPHDPSFKDNAAKAVGLAEFAEKHWTSFGRIHMIRKKKAPNGKELYYRLDIAKEIVRKHVLGVTSNSELDYLFEQEAKTESGGQSAIC